MQVLLQACIVVFLVPRLGKDLSVTDCLDQEITDIKSRKPGRVMAYVVGRNTAAEECEKITTGSLEPTRPPGEQVHAGKLPGILIVNGAETRRLTLSFVERPNP